MNLEYPNKIFVCEYKGDNDFKNGKSHFVIIVAASSRELAKKHVKEMIGFDSEPVMLMNAVYPTIWTSNGLYPLKEQVKILSNNHFHTHIDL